MGVMDKLFGNADGGIANNGSTGPIAAPAPAPIAAAPAAPATSPAPAPGSSLDAFTKLWQNPVDKDGKPIVQQADPLTTNVFNFDPAAITTQAKSLDFVKDVNPELVASVFSGDAATAGPALLKLLNDVQQSAFAAATLSMGNMVNQGVIANNARVKGTLPAAINAAQLAHTPIGDNPVLSHPAVQPLVKALRTTALNKNPNASAAEISTQVNDYITGLATALMEQSPENVAVQQAVADKQTNWTQFLGN